MITKLSLQEIPSNNCRFLRLADNSWYNPNIPVTNGLLEVTPPGFGCPVVFPVSKLFNTALNSSLLKIAPANTYSQLLPLPDGVYAIKYSIAPNKEMFVEYDLFRNCQLLQRYMKAICDLFAEKCDKTTREFQEARRQLIWIKELIDASKYMVEEMGEPTKGIELYNEASRLLGKINDCGCI
jgi:hypothetical protein